MTERDIVGITIEESLQRLKDKGITLKRQGLTRYLRSGEIKGYPPRSDYPQEGWRVNPGSLNEFIGLKTMSINQLRKELKQVQDENYMFFIENRDLKEKNQQLEDEIKRLKGLVESKEVKVIDQPPEGQVSIDDYNQENQEEGKTKRKNRKTGFLEKREDGRYWVKDDQHYFTSGDPIEIKKGNRYIHSRVEHHETDYYVVDLGKDKKLDGMKVRY